MSVQAIVSEERAHLARTLAVLERIDVAAVERLADAVLRTEARGGTVFACGNGGSATTASHFAQDLAKGTLRGADDARRVRVLALTDVSVLTAWANDYGYESVFEQPLRALARRGDLLVAFSGSGNSPNVVRAVRWAAANGIETCAVTGMDGGELKRLAADGVHVPAAEMEVAENAHLVIAHQVVCAVRARMWEADAGG